MMNWKDIPAGTFDENNEAHVQALKERCLQGGHATCFVRMRKLKFAEFSPDQFEESAQSFALNISIDDQFSKGKTQLHLLPGGSDYWWRWVLQIAEWWKKGYRQEQANPSEEQDILRTVRR